ncbi:MAG: hypothetical protein ACM3X4_13295 [Ignavibacteriales bacterium]
MAGGQLATLFFPGAERCKVAAATMSNIDLRDTVTHFGLADACDGDLQALNPCGRWTGCGALEGSGKPPSK